jgi:hypothetical protein
MSFLSDDVNSNRDQDVRRALQPLVDMARRTGAATVLCRHLNKSTGGQAIYRGQGSIGSIGIVRSGLMVGEHPELDDTFVLAGQKHNLSKLPASLAYRIWSAGSGDETAIIEYRGISEVYGTADVVGARGRGRAEPAGRGQGILTRHPAVRSSRAVSKRRPKRPRSAGARSSAQRPSLRCRP